MPSKLKKTIAQVITNLRQIVTHFNHSGPAQEKLHNIQKELNLPNHLLVQGVLTRWNSTYYMLSRLAEQKRTVSLYITEHSVKIDHLLTLSLIHI